VLLAGEDEDGDGLTNKEEIKTYNTNPLVKDTDHDGYDDGEEVDGGNDPNNPQSIPSNEGSDFFNALINNGLLIPIIGGIASAVVSIGVKNLFKKRKLKVRKDLKGLDWKRLEELKIAKVEDASKLIQMRDIEPSSSLNKIRKILENLIGYLFKREFPNIQGENLKRLTLQKKIIMLNKENIFPDLIYVDINTLRIKGNVGSHEDSVTPKDVEVTLPTFVNVLDWFLKHKKIIKSEY
jgi:hypothetical protein